MRLNRLAGGKMAVKMTSRVARAAAADYDGKLHSDVNRHALAKALRGYLAFQATFVIDEEETEEDPKKK